MSNKFLGSAINNDYARETTLEAVEDTLTNGILAVNIVSGGTGGGDVNLDEVGGTATAVNTGNSTAGTQRVVNATDDPNLSNINTNSGLTATNTTNIRSDTQLISADTTILAGGVNLSKYDTNQISINGNNIDVNTGNKSTGTQRMTIADDDTNLSTINTNIADISVDTGNIDTTLTNINTTVDDNGLKFLSSSDRFYIYNENFPNATSKMSQVPTETEYIGWDISGAGVSRIVMVDQIIKNHSRYLVWETNQMYNTFPAGSLASQSEMILTSDSSVNNDVITRFEIDAENNDLEIVISQVRVGSTTTNNLVADSDFNIDILDGSGISRINIRDFDVKYTFRIVLDITAQNIYYQIYSPFLKRFSTFHVFDRNSLGDLDIVLSGSTVNISYINQAGGDFYIESFAVYIANEIDIDLKNLEKYNLRQIQDNQVPLLQSKKLFAYDDDLDIGNKIIGSSSTGKLDLKLIEVAGGEASSVITSNNTLISNYDVEVKYYITNSTEVITTENITLNGNTPVSLANNCYRVISMRKLSSTTNTASGDIFVYRTSDGQTAGIPNDDPLYYMRVDFKNSLLSQLYIPPNRRVFLNELNIIQNIFDGESAALYLYNYFDNTDIAESKYDLILPIKGNSKIEDLNLVYDGPLTLEFKMGVPGQTNINSLSMTLNYIEKKLLN